MAKLVQLWPGGDWVRPEDVRGVRVLDSIDLTGGGYNEVREFADLTAALAEGGA